MYAIFSIPPEKKSKADEILRDDVVSRQSIVIRDCNSLGMKDLGLLVMVEGDDNAVKRAMELFKDLGRVLEGEKAVDAYTRFRKESEDVASGVGLIFG